MLGNTWEARCKLPTKPRCFLWHRYPDRGYQHIYTAHMSPNRPIIFCRGHEAIGCDRTDSVLWLFPAATLKSGADPFRVLASLYDKALALEGAFAKHVCAR